MATRSYPSKQITGEMQKAQLKSLLYSCRSSRLDQFTVDELLRTHSKVPAKTVEYMLTIARQHRADEPR